MWLFLKFQKSQWKHLKMLLVVPIKMLFLVVVSGEAVLGIDYLKCFQASFNFRQPTRTGSTLY